MAKMNGQNNEQALKTVDQILQDIGITDLKKRNPNSFSSGQKKKVLLAQSLLTNPSILIMDEPTAMLDPGSRRDLFNQIERLRKLGKSIFISSHVLSELEQYADSVTVIDKGRLVFTGSIEEINKNIVSNLYAISTNNQPDIKSFCSKHDIKLVPIKNLLCVEIKNEHDKQKLMDFMHVHKITLDD
jgi:ABC-2 type transport system ATP-binding protein